MGLLVYMIFTGVAVAGIVVWMEFRSQTPMSQLIMRLILVISTAVIFWCLCFMAIQSWSGTGDWPNLLVLAGTLILFIYPSVAPAVGGPVLDTFWRLSGGSYFLGTGGNKSVRAFGE